MYSITVSNLITVCIIGVMIVWGWVAYISELIARRTGKTSTVLYPNEGLWALLGTTLLSLGLFGGAFVWKQRAQKSRRQRPLRERRLHSQLSLAGRSLSEGGMR
jgi:uncharacterized protein YneF (UPF0154 family)